MGHQPPGVGRSRIRNGPPVRLWGRSDMWASGGGGHPSCSRCLVARHGGRNVTAKNEPGPSYADGRERHRAVFKRVPQALF